VPAAAPGTVDTRTTDTRTTDTIDRLGVGDRVALIRLRSLGDCVLSTPAIRLLKQYRPDLEIGVIVEDRFASIYRNSPDVAQVLPPTVQALRTFRPVLTVNLHGGPRSGRLTLLSGARFRAGFDVFRPSWIYNVPIPTAQEILGVERRVHTAEHAASALFYLGVPISEVPRASIYAPPGRSVHAPSGAYAVLHPVAATPEKTWPAPSFVEIAHWLRRSLGFEPVIVGGPGDDLSAFAEFRTVAGAPLEEVARLMRDASQFVGNDSGPAHIAAAFGVPVVVIFGPSDREVWAPWKTQAGVLQANGAIASVGVDQVKRAIEAR
jgi:ADP-heptose:LPS heptosyltransferase